MEGRHVATELARVLGVLAHPDRIRIIEELGSHELDVNHLAERLGMLQSTTSQHLAALRHQHLVESRRDGRHVYYSLRQPWLARWLLDGLELLGGAAALDQQLLGAIARAREAWGASKA